jgi:hypothetical protein
MHDDTARRVLRLIDRLKRIVIAKIAGFAHGRIAPDKEPVTIFRRSSLRIGGFKLEWQLLRTGNFNAVVAGEVRSGRRVGF